MAEKLIRELSQVLSLLGCPLLVRNEFWWMEQLLFCPGKARTDLLMWIVSKLAASCYPTELDFDSTFSSASTNSASYRLPENDEGIVDFFVKCGLCPVASAAFVEATLPKEEQVRFWNHLSPLLGGVETEGKGVILSKGYATLNAVVSTDNFLDIFNLKIDLIPADIKLEMASKHPAFTPTVNETLPQLRINPEEEARIVRCAEKLESVVSNFISVCDSDLRGNKADQDCQKLLEVEDGLKDINNTLIDWKESMDTLLDLQKRKTLDRTQRKAQLICKDAFKNQAFQSFAELCRSELDA